MKLISLFLLISTIAVVIGLEPVPENNMQKLHIAPARPLPSSRGNRPPEVLLASAASVRPTATAAPTAIPTATAGPRLVGLGVFRVTSYCEHGVMRDGTWTRAGSVATDPRVVPLGTVLRIEGLDGDYVARDTGGGVLGKWVDVWLPTCQQSREFGRQSKRVWRVGP